MQTNTKPYSLHDLYLDLIGGAKTSYQYNFCVFRVKPLGMGVEVTNGTHTAKHPTKVHSMTEFQGIAALLLNENRDIEFDINGNLINSKTN